MGSTKFFTNFIWRFFEKTGAQLVTFIVSIVLARLLEPTVYGTIALITVFTSILNVFIDSGLGSALVQKKDADELDFSSVFFFNIAMCIVLYALMFVLAPYIAEFYGIEELTDIVRVMSLGLIVSGVNNIQMAYVSRNLLFKKIFFVTMVASLVSAVVGITMALQGRGVWALVAQYLTNCVCQVIMLWTTVAWRPQFIFSAERLKELLSYGWKLLASSLLNTGYNQLRQLLLGKLYTTQDLAYYNRGENFPALIVTNIDVSIDSVLFPTMSCVQDDAIRVREMTSRAIKTSTYIMMPLMVGLAVCAEPIVSLILTDKWLPCVPYLRIFCFTYAFYPIHTSNLNAIMALGRSDLFLKLEIIKKIIGVIVLAITIPISVMAMAYSSLFTSVLSQIINSWPNRKLLNYTYPQQIKDLAPGMLMALVMGAIVWPVQLLGLGSVLTLLIQIPLGAVVYILGSKLFKIESYSYLINVIKSLLSNAHKKWRKFLWKIVIICIRFLESIVKVTWHRII